MEAKMDVNDIIAWVFACVCTIVSVLAGVVAKFYRQQITDYKANEAELRIEVGVLRKRADDCERDRGELRTEVAVLKTRIEKIEQGITNREGEGR